MHGSARHLFPFRRGAETFEDPEISAERPLAIATRQR
jgi:hypothetical protein